MDPRAGIVQVPLPDPVRQLSTGAFHVCAVLTTDALYCWGRDDEGQLGQGGAPADPPVPSPSQVGVEQDWDVVSAGFGHSCGIRAGELYCWGRNSTSQLALGSGASMQLRAPQRVGMATNWLSVASGQLHTCGLRGDDSVWCWGDNTYHQLGLGDQMQRDDPTQLSGLDAATRVDVSNFHSCSEHSDGGRCWGLNGTGEFGLGDTSERSTPVMVAGAGTRVLVGWQHTCLLESSGAVLCSGNNNRSQVGVSGGGPFLTFQELSF